MSKNLMSAAITTQVILASGVSSTSVHKHWTSRSAVRPPLLRALAPGDGAMLEAAKERKQIHADADPGMLVDLIWGACYIRRLLPHLTAQLTPAFARSVVDQALVGILITPTQANWMRPH